MRYKDCARLLTFALIAVPAFAQSSQQLRQQATVQFQTAEKAEAALNEKPRDDRTRNDYVRVIRAYERVYLITPHTGWADNALMSIAGLYEAIDDSRNAIKTLQFLLREYPQTSFKDVAERDVARLSGAVESSALNVASLENIRYFETGGSSRIVIDLSGNADFKTGEALSPDRFFVDIQPARLNSMLTGKEWALQSRQFSKVRVAQFDGNTVRVVLDGARTQHVKTSTLKDPNRIILDVSLPADPAPARPGITDVPQPVQPVTELPAPIAGSAVAEPAAETAPAPVQAPAPGEPVRVVTEAKPPSSGDRSLIRVLGLKVKKVVIDPGHGGHDTGSIGPSGFTEKELALDVSLRLKAMIESELGAEVLLTRSDDTFVPLEARTRMANEAQADLFISVHANSSTTKNVRGVETFFLSPNGLSRDAIETANRENASTELGIHELQDIYRQIRLTKVDESREFAQHVQTAMSRRTNAGANRGVKPALFVVLVGANMPSILAEISFISNPEDETRLKTSDYRRQIAESLFKGVKSYADTLSSTKAAN